MYCNRVISGIITVISDVIAVISLMVLPCSSHSGPHNTMWQRSPVVCTVGFSCVAGIMLWDDTTV